MNVDSSSYREEFRITVPTIVVTGPTAGGKGRLASEIARRLSTGVISLDSMKVYRDMDIGAAKPSLAARRSVPFHLMDLRDPWESFSVGDYIDELRRLEPSLGSRWLIAGGAAFYLNALRHGIFRGPPPDVFYRQRLTEEFEAVGYQELHDRLAAKDPSSAQRIHPTDGRRIIRALEVMESCGRPFSELQALRRPILEQGRCRLIGISRPRDELYERIDSRVLRMFTAGWVDEVKRLCDAHAPSWSAQADQSIGYHQIRAALSAGDDPRERIPLIQQRTRHFARHQLIWFRKMPVEWWRPDEESELLASIDSSLDHYARAGTFPAPDSHRLRNDHL